jgi:hypothetical protein
MPSLMRLAASTYDIDLPPTVVTTTRSFGIRERHALRNGFALDDAVLHPALEGRDDGRLADDPIGVGRDEHKHPRRPVGVFGGSRLFRGAA